MRVCAVDADESTVFIFMALGVTMQSMPKRGRPPEADRRAISLVALKLFERDGFDHVTMDAVATAAEVSRRTLFRLFPSKADLVWDGLDEVLALAKIELATLAKNNASFSAVVEEFFFGMLKHLEDPVVAKLARRRLRLIAQSPVLFGHQAINDLQQVISTAIAATSVPGKAPPVLVANTLVGLAFAAILWWAQNEGVMSASEALRASLKALQVEDA